MFDIIMVGDRVAPEKPDILVGLPRPIISRRQRKEVVMTRPRCGSLNAMWKGGRTISSHGYVLILVGKEHHLADVRGYAYEHRLIAEKKIGRRLLHNELIHHVDGDKTNNAPENLNIVNGNAYHYLHHRKNHNRRKPDESNPLIACGCGCGKRLLKFDPSGRPRKYISGHNMRTTGVRNG